MSICLSTFFTIFRIVAKSSTTSVFMRFSLAPLAFFEPDKTTGGLLSVFPESTPSPDGRFPSLTVPTPSFFIGALRHYLMFPSPCDEIFFDGSRPTMTLIPKTPAALYFRAFSMAAIILQIIAIILTCESPKHRFLQMRKTDIHCILRRRVYAACISSAIADE